MKKFSVQPVSIFSIHMNGFPLEIPGCASLAAGLLKSALVIRKLCEVEKGLEDTGRGKGKLGRSERVAWTYIHYQT